MRFAVLDARSRQGHDAEADCCRAHHGHEQRSESCSRSCATRLARAEPVSRSRDARRAAPRQRARAAELKPQTICKVIMDVDGCANPSDSRSSCSRARPTRAAAKVSRTGPIRKPSAARGAARGARRRCEPKVRAERKVEGEALGKALHEERLAADQGRARRLSGRRSGTVARRTSRRRKAPSGHCRR